MFGHPQGRLEAVGNLDLFVDAVEVGFDSVQADAQLRSDVAVTRA